jgi:molecular chaperone DnaK (HSP70)
MPNFAFGLDFGTSKTAITLAPTGSINPPVNEVAIDGSDRVATCFLRDNSRGGRIYVGEKAEQHYLLVGSSADRVLEFFANFKPHIHQSEVDRDAARVFLTAIRDTKGVSQQIAKVSGDAVFVVGCPVSWVAGGAETLLQLLRDARFPPAFAVPEPVGATFHFLGTRLKAQDFHRDIVVFDWGAGTFDMTVLRAGRMDFEASVSWGSTLYGGRLFDDLFYQWLLALAQGSGHGDDVRQLAVQKTDQAILHGLRCRAIKEAFSRHLATNDLEGPWVFPSTLTSGEIDLGRFRIEHDDEFLERMRNYEASDMARQWIEKAQAEVRPEEREFFEALRNGRPVNLQAWGRMLISEGLSKLKVGEMSSAILTGGSCNWKWFQDEVVAHELFCQRPEEAVLCDEKPELTIARGLARAYSIGTYSRRLSGSLAGIRPLLVDPLRKIHDDLLVSVATTLTDQMSADPNLARDIRNKFAESLARAAAKPIPRTFEVRLRDFFEQLKQLLQGLFHIFSGGTPSEVQQAQVQNVFWQMFKDPEVEAVRPALEQCVKEWLAANRSRLATLDKQISASAHRQIMVLLKQYLDIGGLVEVAIEACGATGETTFDVAFKELGNKVDFGPGMINRIFDWLEMIVRTATSDPKATSRPNLDEQSKELTNRFLLALPAAIRENITQIQTADAWAQRILDDLTNTLETLARVARIDYAPDATTNPAP